MSNYRTPGGSNLVGNPYAPRMGDGQREKFLANVRKAPSLAQLIEEQREAGFSCHGPWEDPSKCQDGPCASCPFWQMDAPEQDPKEFYAWLNGVCEAELG